MSYYFQNAIVAFNIHVIAKLQLMPQNKKHHYVPQSYLRFFSNDGKMVWIYNLKNNGLFRAEIKNICYENYFYGRDSGLEESYSPIEGIQYNILKKIIDSRTMLKLTDEEQVFLRLFLLFQHTRTKEAKQVSKMHTDFMTEKYIKPLLKGKLATDSNFKNNGLTDDVIDKIRIRWPADYIVGMYTAFTSVYGISDLVPILIVNLSEINFITSDAPITFYNYKNIKNRSTIGLLSRGLIILCPLNSKTMLMLLDGSMYDIYPDKDMVIYCKYEKDINALNTLQFINNPENIIFKEESDANYVKKLYMDIKPFIQEKKFKTDIVSTQNIESDKISNIEVTYIKDTLYRLSLSFLKLNKVNNKSYKKEVKYITEHKLPVVPIRSREIRDHLIKYKKELEEEFLSSRPAKKIDESFLLLKSH